MPFSLRAGGAACAVLFVSIAFYQPGRSAELSPEVSPERLTLPRAIAEAFARSPALDARRAEVEQAEGRRLSAGKPAFDPRIAVEGAHRSNGGTSTDHEVRLSQELEIGGQRRERTAQMESELGATRARLLHAERLLAAHVEAAFVEALRARELVEIERANVELVESLREVARKRFEAGAVAQMEVNLAEVQVGRAGRDLQLAEAAHEVARALLAQVVGLDPAVSPEVEGRLDLPPREPPSLSALLESAREHRADLQSFRSAAEAARAGIELARSEALPNLEVQAFHGREEGTDRLLGAAIEVGIPLFRRQKGRVTEALAGHRQALAETEAAELEVRQQITASLARYRASEAGSRDLQQLVLGTLEENLGLLQRSYDAGKIDWTEVLVFRREFVEIERDLIETLTDARLAGIELNLAAGIAPLVSHEESQP